MSKNFKELYVGSLSYDVTEYDIEKLFSVSGRVTSIHLITDLKTGEFKGCGYVRMSSEAEAKDAVASLDGAMLIDRQITVSIANPQKIKAQGGGYKGKNPDPAKAGGKGGGSASGAKPAAAKTAAGKPASAKQTPLKSAATKSAPAKGSDAKPRFAKADGAKPGFSKADSPRTDVSKSGTSKTGFAKPAGAKTGPSRTGKR